MAYEYKPYEESEAVKQYRQQMEQLMQQKPGEYQSQWQQAMSQAANDVMNRKKFQYNMSSDPLYQQYKQQYQRQGKLAMQDTLGQALAANGGYGSSYAQMAGQQAYNSQLQQLNDKVPELYQMALEKYQMEGQDALNRFGIASQMENTDYSRYKDTLSAWQADRDYATGRYDNERSTDYNLWADKDKREYERYQNEQELARKQVDYLLSIGVRPSEELLALAGYDEKYVKAKLKRAKQKAAASSSGARSVNLVTEATRVSQLAGAGAAIRYIQEQTKGRKSPEAVKAQANAKGVAQTEYYRRMLAAMAARKK